MWNSDPRRPVGQESGSALVMALAAFLAMAVLSYCYVVMTSSAHKENAQAVDELRAFYVAEAALSEAVAALRAGGPDAVKPLAVRQVDRSTTFWVDSVIGAEDAALDDDLLRLQANAVVDGQASAVEMVVRLRDAEDEDYVFGMFGRDRVSMASNTCVDSYDSSLGTWSSQISGTIRGIDYANTSGALGSNGDITLASNSVVCGDATPGVGDGVSIAGNAGVLGSTAPAVADVVLPAVPLPVITGPGGTYFRDSGTHTLPPGDYEFSSFTLDSTATIVIQGPARFLIQDYSVLSNASIDVDSTGGPVQFYVTGTFLQKSNTFVRPRSLNPRDLYLFVDGPGPDVVFDSNTQFVGVVFAPERDLVVNSNVDIFGAVAAARIQLDSNAGLHYDESLASGEWAGGGDGPFEVLSWRPVAPSAP